jgi:hypothetical protein
MIDFIGMGDSPTLYLSMTYIFCNGLTLLWPDHRQEDTKKPTQGRLVAVTFAVLGFTFPRPKPTEYGYAGSWLNR